MTLDTAAIIAETRAWVDRAVMVVLPAPVPPTKAIFCPGMAYMVMSCSTVFSGV